MKIIKGLCLSLSLLSLFGSTHAADLESLLKMDKFQQAEYIEGISSPEIDSLKKELVVERSKEEERLKQNKAWLNAVSEPRKTALLLAFASGGLTIVSCWLCLEKISSQLPDQWERMAFKRVYDQLCELSQSVLTQSFEGKLFIGSSIAYMVASFSDDYIYWSGQKGELGSLERLVALYNLEKVVCSK